MTAWFAAGLLDWAARCDAAGRPEAAAAAVRLAGAVRERPVPDGRRLRVLATQLEAAGELALASAARRVADDLTA